MARLFKKKKEGPVRDLHACMQRATVQSDAKVRLGDSVYLTHVDGMRVKYIVRSKTFKLRDPFATGESYEDWRITYHLKWFRNPDIEVILRDESDIELITGNKD